MYNTNINDFIKDIDRLFEKIIKCNEPVTISTESGNAIVLSEYYYRGLIETLNISSAPKMKEKITDGLNTPISECVYDECEW